MSVTADMSSSLALNTEQTAASASDPQLERRQSTALSISSLSDESSRPQTSESKTVATEACRDVERELEAIETRLSAFQERRRNDKSTSQNAKDKEEDKSDQSSVSNTSSQIFSKLSKAQQEAGAVADQVATTLMKCDQLLQRAKSSASNASVSVWDVNTLAIEDEEAILTQKAAAVKHFAARCQRDIETSTTKIELHHQKIQNAYLKELQRKYDSKKHMTLMNLREKYEKETKALVRTKMEEFEFEEASAVKKTRETLLEERIRTLEELHNSHNVALEESLSHLEMQLTTTTDREKRELNSQLEEELNLTLKQMQDENRKSMERWEIEQRRKMEQELFEHRETTVASVLKAQEEKTTMLKQEIQASHFEKEEAELQKLKKALTFGAQAQLQHLRKRLEMEHEEKMNEIKMEASLSLDKETEKLTQMLTRSHREQQEQLQRDLDKKNRVKIMELHDTMQASHQKSLQALNDAAEQRRIDALATHRQDFEQECRQELQVLEQTLEQEMSTKLRQLEMQHADECELKLEQLRTRAVNHHARELEAKRSRMIQCKNILIAEATAFLSFDNNLSKSSFNDRGARNESNPEDNSAAAHLFELKKHLSKELAQYVDVMVSEFDELAEEQRILVAKIAESTQLYLSYKRQCGVLEGQSEELSTGLETLHNQLQQKDAVCKKLYQANEALLKRLQTPVLQASKGATKSEAPSPRVKQSPVKAKTLHNASKLETSKAWR
ncbi:hypothetical protein PHMEG_0004245 [Phytophthora megakarya]|uniref:Uncharacterized protein n=1 Tax=Phytophthora megakarya TaxID=4795 RepID=A0A225WUG0_9STRA|nr:hypothetical protein PHMEG_0004245 [Phytophthora megakarya]